MSGRNAQNAAIDHQNEQIRKQYDMDLKNYEFSYGKKARRDEKGNLAKDEQGNVIFDQLKDKDGTKSGRLNDQYDHAVEGLAIRKAKDKELSLIHI